MMGSEIGPSLGNATGAGDTARLTPDSAQRGGSFGIEVSGVGTLAVTHTDKPGSITPNQMRDQPEHSAARWMFEQAAQANGFDPKTIVKGSPQDQQVTRTLSETLTHLGELPRGGGVASEATSVRSLIQQAARTAPFTPNGAEVALSPAETELAMALAPAANAPGGAVFADPAVFSVTRQVAAQVLTRGTPQMKAALIAGGAAAVAAGTVAGPHDGTSTSRPASTGDAKPETETKANQSLAAARAALDTNRDDVLQCREIGQWIPDIGVESRSLNAQAYQAHVTGRPGEDFEVVTPITGKVRFDGCVDLPAGADLLEAKGDHGVLLTDKATSWSAARAGVVAQGQVQQAAAAKLGVAAEWHVQTTTDHAVIQTLFARSGILLPVIHDPMPPAK
jgi:hypothetical protein